MRPCKICDGWATLQVGCRCRQSWTTWSFGIPWRMFSCLRTSRTNIFGHRRARVLTPLDQLMLGSFGFEPYKRLWKSWAPLRCKIFLWLAMLNRCWTADRLARRGLQHPDKCLLCDQEEETVQHILTSCVFARQVWTTVLGRVGLQHLAPTLEFDTFKDWWRWAARRAPKAARKGMNSLVILTAWSI